MPYIYPESREPLDAHINDITAYVTDPAELSYVICRLLSRLISQAANRPNYRILTAYLSAVKGAAAEFERRVLAPYEEAKRAENGEVFIELVRGYHE